MSRTREHGKVVWVREGTRVIEEGSKGDAAYEIVSGRMEVSTSRGGKTLVLGRLGPGQVFGELGLIGDAPRTANVVAVKDCTLRVITRSAFDRLLRRDPQKLYPLLKTLFERLRLMNAKYLMALEYQTLPGKSSGSPTSRAP